MNFSPADFFETDYDRCRDDFLSRCAGLERTDAQLLNFAIADDCFCDALWLGDSGASKVLVLISGTHGVEGFAGSAIQRFVLDLLSRGQLAVPPSTALVMLHALNPWGMRWARRCDQQGIDLNRNFVDFGRLPEPDDDQNAVTEAQLQTSTADTVRQLNELARVWGQRRFDEAFSGGQYHAPWAPFFGGRAAAGSQRVIDDIATRWQLKQRQLAVIDLHTGLGPWGYGELISDHPRASAGNEVARRLFGQAVAVTAEGQSFSVPKQGLLDYRWHGLMEKPGFYLTLEFGTLPTETLFLTLLDEHRYWRDHDPQADPEGYGLLRRKMLEHFLPADELWREGILFRAWQVVRRILEDAE